MISSQQALSLEKIEDPENKIMNMMPQIETKKANRILKTITEGVMSQD